MILKELYELYGRLVKQGAYVPVMGQSKQKISFRVVITQQGDLVRIEDAREQRVVRKQGKNKVTESIQIYTPEIIVLGYGKPSGSGVNPCFLFDNPAYLLGCVAAKSRAKEYYQRLCDMHLSVEKEINSPSYSAVCRFLEKWTPEMCETEMTNKDLYTGNGIFQILGQDQPVHEDPIVRAWWFAQGARKWRNESPANKGMCLVSGEFDDIAVLHEPAIKGVVNAQSVGAKLVSFNCKSFESYGKEQSENSPVSEQVAFGYCNALNYLLDRKESRVRIGDATTVFWTDAPVEAQDEWEALMGGSMDPSRLEAQDNELNKRVNQHLLRLAEGQLPTDMLTSDTRFFVLGLAPNAARLSVRFFKEGPLTEFLENMRDHYTALQLQRRHEKFHDRELISPYQILRETARDADDIAPLWGGSLMRSILFKLPYPDSIAGAIIRRFRADGNVNYIRCAYLKAWLTRKTSQYHIKPMLDEENKQIGYVLGRLFALLVKTQRDALGDINRTIQDAYYSSASATPRTVFPRLLKMYRHHVAKLQEDKVRKGKEKEMQRIMSMLTDFPANMGMEQQGLFALGFYHQMQYFYTPKSSNPEL